MPADALLVLAGETFLDRPPGERRPPKSLAAGLVRVGEPPLPLGLLQDDRPRPAGHLLGGGQPDPCSREDRRLLRSLIHDAPTVLARRELPHPGEEDAV